MNTGEITDLLSMRGNEKGTVAEITGGSGLAEKLKTLNPAL